MREIDLFFYNIGNILLSRSTNERRIFLIFLDSLIIAISYVSIFHLTNSENGSIFFEKYNILFFLINILIGISIYSFSGQYTSLSRYFTSLNFYKICIRNLSLICIMILIEIYLKTELIGAFGWIMFWIVTTFIVTTIRFIIRDWIQIIRSGKHKNKINVAIYGAGSAGLQLYTSIQQDKKYSVKFFIDDDNKLCKRVIGNIKIESFDFLLRNRDYIDKVLFAIPSISGNKLKRKILQIQHINLPILRVPSIEDLNSGLDKISKLSPISIDDLVGREKVVPDKNLLFKDIDGKNVCVIGAGGSIGEELCNQIIRMNPKKIILFERNEMSLYKIDQKLKDQLIKSKLNIKLRSILGSANQKDLLEKIFDQEKVNIVFNTAAYKHVPIVENNPIAGLSNNIISAQNICEACISQKVNKMVYISSDKAVRPTNIMGASKRVAELIVKAYSKKEISSNTIFTMVRFGNVLGSSGSVVPLFNKQIEKGGPITITHPEITRYFMTSKEAAQLVIQSSTLSKGGEIFLLNMGNPIKILDLATQMIKLKGLKVKEKGTNNGDIEIKFTGLRPGEKLYEELLCDGISLPTIHPLIFQSKEEDIKPNLFQELKVLKDELSSNNLNGVKKSLKKLVPEWSSIKYKI